MPTPFERPHSTWWHMGAAFVRKSATPLLLRKCVARFISDSWVFCDFLSSSNITLHYMCKFWFWDKNVPSVSGPSSVSSVASSSSVQNPVSPLDLRLSPSVSVSDSGCWPLHHFTQILLVACFPRRLTGIHDDCFWFVYVHVHLLWAAELNRMWSAEDDIIVSDYSE